MATGSVPITAGSGTPIRVVTNSAVDSGADQQVFTLADQYGVLSGSDPDGTLNVSDTTALFLDTFDTSLTNFTVGGTVVPTWSAGQASYAPGTTASATSFGRTNYTFALRPPGSLRSSFLLQLNTAAIANNTRWWGYGTNQASPTSTAPVLNGVVFMLDPSAGALMGAVYSNGTRTQTLNLTLPTDGIFHRYDVWFRQTIAYFVIDGVPVGSISRPAMQVTNNQYMITGSVNGATAPSTAPVFNLSSESMADADGLVGTIGDTIFPTIQASVKAAQAPSPAATDNLFVVQAVPPPQFELTATGAAAAAVTLTLPAPAAGLRHYVTSVAFDQYATAATTGSATPIVTTASNHVHVATLPTALAIGVKNREVAMLGGAGATAQATATSFTAPATTGILWRITATYYIAP